jgi:hypothetical protein
VQGLFGLHLGCCFAPNHKGMPVLEDDREPDYLRRQVLTSRNVRGGRLVLPAAPDEDDGDAVVGEVLLA